MAPHVKVTLFPFMCDGCKRIQCITNLSTGYFDRTESYSTAKRIHAQHKYTHARFVGLVFRRVAA